MITGGYSETPKKEVGSPFKLKEMKNLINLLAICLLVCISCNKATDFELNHEKEQYFLNQSTARSTVIPVDPSNDDNSVDSVGSIHNLILDTIAFHPGFDTLDIILATYNYVNSELEWEELDLELYLPYSKMDSLIDTIWYYCMNDNFEGAIDYIVDKYDLSQNLSDELDDLYSVLDYDRGDVGITDLIDSIIVKEDNFSAGSFSAREQMIYFGTASVLRHSAAYWNTVMDDASGSHPYYDIVGDMLDYYDEEFIEFGGNADTRKWNWRKILESSFNSRC